MQTLQPVPPVDDPRVVTYTFGGKEYQFWFCWIGRNIAREQYGYDITKQDPEDGDMDAQMESVYRSLWVCHLPFAPDMTFEHFASRFAFGDFAALREALDEVAARQLDGSSPKKTGARKK